MYLCLDALGPGLLAALIVLVGACGGGSGGGHPDALPGHRDAASPDAAAADTPAGPDAPVAATDAPVPTADAGVDRGGPDAAMDSDHPPPADAPAEAPRADAADGGSAGGACAERRGGALIELGACSTESFTVWITNPAFIDEAIAHKGGKGRIPVFDLADGRDCDPTWTWHVDPTTAAWADLATEVCDGCPRFIENDKASWIGAVKRYCPWSATVISVEDHRP
jgi:hypothetical protein